MISIKKSNSYVGKLIIYDNKESTRLFCEGGSGFSTYDLSVCRFCEFIEQADKLKVQTVYSRYVDIIHELAKSIDNEKFSVSASCDIDKNKNRYEIICYISLIKKYKMRSVLPDKNIIIFTKDIKKNAIAEFMKAYKFTISKYKNLEAGLTLNSADYVGNFIEGRTKDISLIK